MKAFKVLSFLGLFFLLFSSISYGAHKPKFSKGEKISYINHSGACKGAKILRVIKGAEICYIISCGLFTTQILENSVVKGLRKKERAGAFHYYPVSGPRATASKGRKAKENQIPPLRTNFTASAKRWDVSRSLPVEKEKSPLVPL